MKCPEAITPDLHKTLVNIDIKDDINKVHGHCQGLGCMLKNLDKSILVDVERILDDIIVKSHHFSNADKTSHLIRPSVLFLLNQFADFDSLTTQRASDWSKKITDSVLTLGAISSSSNCDQLYDLCAQMTPSMAKLRKIIKDEELKQQEFSHLIKTIRSNDIKIPENARICAAFLLKSFERSYFTESNIGLITEMITEGARSNFSLQAVAKTNIRAYFVDMRVQLLVLLVEHKILDFGTISTCFEDYTRNNRGDIGSRLRIGAMRALQTMPLDSLSDDEFIKFFGLVLQQGAEKITNVRLEAGVTMLKFFSSKRPHLSQVEEIANKIKTHKDTGKEGTLRNKIWKQEWGGGKCFPKYANILHLTDFQKPILKGLLVSSGDLTQSLSSAASDCLFTYLDRISSHDDAESKLTEFVATILSLWKNDNKNLLTKPVLKVFDEFFSK